METPPILVLKSTSKEQCEKIIENARSEDIFDVELVTTQESNDGMQFRLFEIDTTWPSESIRFCQSICSANEDIKLWCFMDEEPEQFLVKGGKGEVHTKVYEVEIDGTPCQDDDGSYGDWHEGLPDDWHYGAYAP